MINELLARSIEGKQYRFISYTGEVTLGFLQLDRKNRQWYLIPCVNAPLRGIGVGQDAEFGTPVDLNSLEFLEQEIEDMESYDSKISFYPHPEVKLIIIGAGASYDISGQKGFRLPMTRDLFASEHQDDWKKFSGVTALYSDLHGIQNLEVFFERQWKKLESGYNPRLMAELINVQYYLQYFFLKKSIEGRQELPNYYRSLVRQMRDHPKANKRDFKFVVVNFNYDTLFEDALTQELGYSFNSITDYDDFSREILVYKPHGSANWCRYVKAEYQHEFDEVKSGERYFFSAHADNAFKKQMTIALFSKILENKISVMTDEINHFEQTRRLTNMFTDLGSMKSFFPQLLIPLKSKDDFLMPDSQIARLKLLLNYVERIYIFGWKGGEDKFLEILKASLPQKKIHAHAFTTANGYSEITSNLSPHIRLCEFKNSTKIGFAKSMMKVSNSEEGLFSGRLDFSAFDGKS